MTYKDFVADRYIDVDDLEEHDPKHPNIKPHTATPLLIIVGAVALVAGMGLMFIMSSFLTMS